LVYCLAAYAGLLVPQRKWNDLMDTLIGFARSSRPDYTSLAVRILTTLVTDLEKLMEANIGVLVNLLEHVLPIEDQSVRAASLEYFGALLSLSSDDESFETMINLIPSVLQTILKSAESRDFTAVVFGVDAFIAIAEAHPLFLKTHLIITFDTMLAITEMADCKGRPRRLAMEFICTMAEIRVGLLRRHSTVLPRAMATLLQWMTGIEEEELSAWEAVEEDEFKRHVRIARDDLDRLSVAFKDHSFLELFFGHMTEMLGNPQWQVRHAALMSMLSTAEGMCALLAPNIGEILTQLTPLFSDPYPRVRWAALMCLSQLCTDVGPDLQANAHEVAMRCIFTGLADSSVKVRVQAVSTIINFCEQAEEEVISLYADALLDKLGEALHLPSVSAQEWALTAIAALASSCKNGFHKYVDAVIPICMNIVRGAASKEHRLLRGRAFEATTHIGAAIGKERFAPLAAELMQHMLSVDLSRTSSDDPQVRLLIESSARIAQVLGEDFAPFLPRVMESLTVIATTDPVVRVADDDEGSDDDEWEYHDMEGQRYAIHQPSLEDKADALQCLARYAEHVGAPFAPYVPQLAEYILPNIEAAGNERVQETEASILPFLVGSVAKFAQRYPEDAAAQLACTTLSRSVITALCKLVHADEVETDWHHLYVQTMCETTANLHKAGRRHVFDYDVCQQVVETSKALIERAIDRRADRDAERNDEDHDEDLEADFHEEENRDTSILVNSVELLENTLMLQGASFVPQWRNMLHFAVEWLSNPAALPIDVHLGVCLLDDVIEHGEAAGLEFFDDALRQQLRFADAEDDGVRQAALYGLGASAVACGALFTPHVGVALQVLWHAIEGPEARATEGKVQVAENAISAVGKILLSRPQEVPNAAEMVARYVSHLPIVVDDVEAIVIYGQFVQFAALYPQAVFGAPPDAARLQHVLNVIGTALETKCVDEKVTVQFTELLKHIQTAMPANEVAAAFGALDALPRARIQRVIEAQQ
jgi:hypothetical protein